MYIYIYVYTDINDTINPSPNTSKRALQPSQKSPIHKSKDPQNLWLRHHHAFTQRQQIPGADPRAMHSPRPRTAHPSMRMRSKPVRRAHMLDFVFFFRLVLVFPALLHPRLDGGRWLGGGHVGFGGSFGDAEGVEPVVVAVTHETQRHEGDYWSAARCGRRGQIADEDVRVYECVCARAHERERERERERESVRARERERECVCVCEFV